MKTLTLFAAIAAVIAGASIVNAQTPASPAVKGTGKFCAVGTPSGKLNCKYASLDACQKDPKKPKCAPNPNAN